MSFLFGKRKTPAGPQLVFGEFSCLCLRRRRHRSAVPHHVLHFPFRATAGEQAHAGQGDPGT